VICVPSSSFHAGVPTGWRSSAVLGALAADWSEKCDGTPRLDASDAPAADVPSGTVALDAVVASLCAPSALALEVAAAS
jgi:hypothetical protein